MDSLSITTIAHYRGPFGSKFGIPRQSSLAPSVQGRIVFEPEYRVREALRGLEGFSRIWLIWGFHANRPTGASWQPTVRPPRLGGNTSMGVFATRSPFRPNPLGLSSVELVKVDNLELIVRGADLMDGTPIYDIKPYISYSDAYPDARSGFAPSAPEAVLRVEIPSTLPFTDGQRKALREILSLDPRPAYQRQPGREYAMLFDGVDVFFSVSEDGLLTVTGYRKL